MGGECESSNTDHDSNTDYDLDSLGDDDIPEYDQANRETNVTHTLYIHTVTFKCIGSVRDVACQKAFACSTRQTSGRFYCASPFQSRTSKQI